MKDTKASILSAAIHGVRLYGLEGVRIQHIARLAGTSAGNIYAYFDSKDSLLLQCFEDVDRQIAHIFDLERPTVQALAQNPEAEIKRLWNAYYSWLVEHPDETVFYHRFRDNPGYPAFERTRDVSYFASFIQTVSDLHGLYNIFDGVNQNVFWLYVLTCTVLFAKHVAEGVLPNNDATRESVFLLIMGGVSATIKK